MELTVVLAWLTLLVGVPLNVLASYLLFRQWRRAPHLRVLKERFIFAVAVTFLVALFAVVFVNNDQVPPPINLASTKILTRAAMLTVALVGAVGWLRLYRSFRKKDKL